MIYRIIGESEHLEWTTGEDPKLIWVAGALKGACDAGLAWEAWRDLPTPSISNPRVRFWFTEAGWDKYGRDVLAEAMRSGRVYRLLRKKNPPRSAVVYRDKWQVAVLPVKW